MKRRVIIVGAGASGLVAAIAAASEGASVTVLEAMNKPGTKLLRTGSGKCNYTHTGPVGASYRGRQPSFANEVLANFSAEDTIAFFKNIGIYPLEKEHWVYPHSEQATSVLACLTSQLHRLHVKLKTREIVTDIIRHTSGGALFTVRTKTWQYEGDAVIVSTGSCASVGETFPGLSLLQPFSLDIAPFHPALTYLLVPDHKKTAAWAGVRARAQASLCRESGKKSKLLWQENGQIQFTSRGISGIPVFDMSSLAYKELSRGEKLCVLLDFFPEAEERELVSFLENVQLHATKKNIKELLTGLIPEKLIPCLCDSKMEKISDLAHAVKRCAVPVTGTGPLEASQCAGGGVAANAVDPGTLMVKEVPGLFVTGEMIDIDGICGGWNLQFAWATGFLAGKASAVKSFDAL